VVEYTVRVADAGGEYDPDHPGPARGRGGRGPVPGGG
jgi:hypothetical protein